MQRVTALKVGRKHYVVEHKVMSGFWGYTLDHPARIVVSLDQKAERLAETYMHELLHAVWGSKKLADRVTEEVAVTALAHGLAMVARDNPGLFSHIEALAGSNE